MFNLMATLGRRDASGGPSEFTGRLRSFIDALDSREGYVAGHSTAVSELAVVVARTVGVPEPDLESLALGAVLHDVGKMFVDRALLIKEGALSSDELAVFRLHPELGEALVQSTTADRRVLDVVRSHHERWDGTGYPDGLKGDAIPIGARVVAAADAFVAMRESRVYRRALSLEDALGELRDGAGRQFDPACADAVRLLGARRAES
jgi:putative nucleotidyltransferase with HDIG domain